MSDIPLGRPTDYPERYDASLLASMPRSESRTAHGLDREPTFAGEDVWRGYEFSWLSKSGMPRVAGVRLGIPASSPHMLESKAVKRYLNSFAQSRFDSADEVRDALVGDLGAACGAAVEATVQSLGEIAPVAGLSGQCLDGLDVEVTHYDYAPELLAVGHGPVVSETLHTHLFRSLCPVTGQPDWASLLIRYRGVTLDRAGLLRYLVSYRRHAAFHETTIERIFVDLKTLCGCQRLLVGGYFLRRGGVDINPFRADPGERWPILRLARQ